MTSVIVAVDIDGVVNALALDPAGHDHFARWDRRTVLGFRLTVAGEVVEWMRSLEERGGRFHWATTWTPNRHLLEDVFGLPGHAPIAADPDAPVPQAPVGVSWKGAQIADLVRREPAPLVWMDDDAITPATAAHVDEVIRELDLPGLALTPSPLTGLTPDDLARIDDFLDTVQGGTAPIGLQRHPAG
jgi:hypothetical protein